MKKQIIKNSDDEQIITKGFIKEELRELGEKFATKDFLKQEFAIRDEKLDRLGAAMLNVTEELKNMRHENQEFYKMREQLYAIDGANERQIKDHEQRIFKLEIAR